MHARQRLSAVYGIRGWRLLADHPPLRSAFTLIEMLAVIMIVSLVASVTMVSVASMTDRAVWRRAVAAFGDLDAKARLLARRGGATQIVPMEQLDGLMLIQADQSAPVARATLANGMTVHITDPAGRTLSDIRIDRLGRSIDYQLVIQLGGEVRRWSVCGPTGWLMSQEKMP